MLTDNAVLSNNTKALAALELKRLLTGKILLDRDPDYDLARKLWNGMIDRKPFVICQCLNSSDIRHALAFARHNGLPVSIRGGGHNVAGNAICEDGVMIDLSMMKNFSIYERLKLQLRGEAYNLPNHPVFNSPSTSVGSAGFGVISSQANSPRNVQVALRLIW